MSTAPWSRTRLDKNCQGEPLPTLVEVLEATILSHTHRFLSKNGNRQARIHVLHSPSLRSLRVNPSKKKMKFVGRVKPLEDAHNWSKQQNKQFLHLVQIPQRNVNGQINTFIQNYAVDSASQSYHIKTPSTNETTDYKECSNTVRHSATDHDKAFSTHQTENSLLTLPAHEPWMEWAAPCTETLPWNYLSSH